jgi:hypothetical protein
MLAAIVIIFGRDTTLQNQTPKGPFSNFAFCAFFAGGRPSSAPRAYRLDSRCVLMAFGFQFDTTDSI